MFGLRPVWPLPAAIRVQPLLRSLLPRFMVVTLPLLLVFVVFNLFFVGQREQNALTEELRKRALSIGRNLALNGTQARETFGDPLLAPLSRAAAALPDVAWVAFTDEKGRILAEAGPETSQARRAGPLAEAALRQHEALAMVSDGEQRFVGVCLPLRSRLGSLGAVQLGLRIDRLQAAATASWRHALTLTLLLVAAITLITLPLVYATIRPLRFILQAARDIARGHLEARVPTDRSDELGRLTVAFNRMAERLSDLVEREHAKRAELEARVTALRACSEQVAQGRLDVRAPVADDELGRLAAGFNEMVAHVQRLVEQERASRKDLEANQEVLQTANARLLARDRRKSDFLNTVSHELRTPLTSIKAFSEILIEQGEDAREEREFLGIIDHEADRLTRLIEDLLDLSRIEAEPAGPALVDLALGEVVESCVRAFHALAEQKGVNLSCAIERPIRVRGDRDRLAQVVTNLLSNAMKFTPSGGQIVVHLDADASGVTMTVRDTGVGIPADALERIFEEFQQVERGQGEERTGSGLGLPIVRGIIGAHGGQVRVHSEEGRGSTFSVWLPAIT